MEVMQLLAFAAERVVQRSSVDMGLMGMIEKTCNQLKTEVMKMYFFHQGLCFLVVLNFLQI